jgi:radical SAM superfamily enzyme YgiQ (UPF0313 family)
MKSRKVLRLALIQPPIWGNLRTPWEIAYIKSYLESRGPYEVKMIDLGPETLPLVEQFGAEVVDQVDDSFETETYLSSLGFLTSIADSYLIRLFCEPDSPEFKNALLAVLRNKTTHRGEALERLLHTFLKSPFYERLEQRFRQLSTELAEGEFDYIGCTTHLTTYPIALFLLKCVKEAAPQLRTVLSGYSATMLPSETLRACPWIDFVIRGESEGGYEQIFSDKLLDRQVVDRHGMPLDMNEVPAPDYRGLDLSAYRLVSIMPSRNCPYGKCEFCQEDAFWSTFRFRKPELLVDDMEVQYQRHGVTRFDFVDLDMRDFALDLCRELERRGLDFRWSGAMRADQGTPPILKKMAPHQCKSIFFGFETASRRLLHLIRKNITPETLKDTMAVARDIGIRVKLTCITGLPTETKEEFEGTLDFVRQNAEYIRIVLVQCFKALNRTPIAMAMALPDNKYGLLPIRVKALEPVQSLLSEVRYMGIPSPEVAMQRLVRAREAFREWGVGERAILLSSNKQHRKHLLGIR